MQPYDANYLKEKGIKHMSFHAYVKMMQNKLRDAGMSTDQVHVLDDHVRRRSELVGRRVARLLTPLFQPMRLQPTIRWTS